ncbi:MAG: hypothetical protein M1832_000771 [Thelocarpon impressellum]|nr:MAG: hypothetical protein M1832_000771 [Thelocarpon impressellum]
MWMLECDGDTLQNKRLWLRPGKRYLFGRTKTGPGGFAIENKSISRKHLTIEISVVEPGSGSSIHSRSTITVEDQNSKVGTLLDGEQIRGQSRVLAGEQHDIRLGTFQHLFRIRWQPVVLSFSFSSKEQKNRDPLVPARARLEALDIKVIIPYVVDKTTHVVASKRNTAKGLQALINGKYIVTDSFIDTLADAAAPGDPETPESISRLEEDFDAAWPDALQHLPAQSKEPSQRAAAFFAPDQKRIAVFDGYTFIFCDQTQFDNLQAPITNGGGKALLFKIIEDQTTPDDFVRYIKDVAGEKGTGEFEDGSEGEGVVVVRFRGRKGNEDWNIELGNEVARRLDQRLIEQSEFLDAILVNDARGLRMPLPEEDDDGPPAEQAPIHIRKAPAPASAAPAQTTRLRSRRLVTSKFKGFDDGFDPSSIPQPPMGEDPSQPDNENGQASGMEVDLVVDSQPASSHISRKRPAPQSEGEENEDEVMDEMLPAAAAMKRRRIEGGDGERAQTSATSAAESRPGSRKGASRKAKELDVLEVAREHREAEEAARRDEEALDASMGGMDVEQMRNLALVEEMPVKERSERPTLAEAGGRWDERWNGRKNFKKFRRRGGEEPRRGRTVIVGFEEVRNKDFGIGEEYWIESDKQRKKPRERESPMQTTPYATARSQPATSEPAEQDTSDVTDGQRTARLADKPKPAGEIGGTQGKSRATTSKRATSSQLSKPGASKKQKALFVRDSESDDSDDELKFRFKKRR